MDWLADLLRRFGGALQARSYHSLACVVKSYDAATQCADLEVMVRAPVVREENEEDVEHEALPIIPNVRVAFPAFGSGCITFPIAVGDEGLFIVSTLQTSEYRRMGQQANAVHVARGAIGNGGWFVPCKLTDAATLPSAATDALVLEHETEVRIGKDASEYIAMANKVLDELNAIADAFNAHTHEVSSFGSPSTAPDSPITPGSVAATKGKVE